MAALENAKRERFCQELLVDDNATRAYVRAGYSEKGAAQGAERLLRKVEMQARVAELRAGRAQRLEITQEKVIADLEELRTKAAAAGHFGPAVKAAELQGRHIGMWSSKAADRIADSLEELIKQSYGDG